MATTVHANTYYKDPRTGHIFMSGWPLPKTIDSDTVFTNCDFHCSTVMTAEEFTAATFNNCTGQIKVNGEYLRP